MKRLLCALLLVVAGFTPAAAEPPDSAQLKRLRSAQTVRLTVDQSYFYTTQADSAKKTITGFHLPFAAVARGLLEDAGLTVIEPARGESGDYDATLEIVAQGRAIARFYDDQGAAYLYTGAEITGDITLTPTGLAAWHTAFRSTHGPPLTLQINLGFDRPRGAPFSEVFSGPISFTARMVEVIGRIYGSPPLIAAQINSAFAVRLHAVRVLGMIGGAGAIEALLAVITDKDPRLRKEAAWSLGRLRARRATDALTLALADSDMDVRWFAAWSLGKIKEGL